MQKNELKSVNLLEFQRGNTKVHQASYAAVKSSISLAITSVGLKGDEVH